MNFLLRVAFHGYVQYNVHIIKRGDLDDKYQRNKFQTKYV